MTTTSRIEIHLARAVASASGVALGFETSIANRPKIIYVQLENQIWRFCLEGVVRPEAAAEYQLLIAGEHVAARGGATLATIDPTTGTAWASLADASAPDVDDAVQAAADTFRSTAWRGLPATRRGRLLMRLGDLIEANAEQLASLESTDNGKLYRDSLAQIRSVATWLDYFGGLADKVEGRVIPMERTSVFNYTLREPLGVIAIITPWNTPTLLAMMAAAPAVAMGNCVVIKPSEVASVGTLKVVDLATEAGFPPGVFNLVTGGPAAGEALVEHPLVAKISFTGGTETGRKIALKASGRLVRPLLELGGKSANLVFADCDRAAAIGGILAGIFGSAGQSCVAGSRALIERSIYDEFVSTLAQRAGAIRVGDPMAPETQMGPLATLPLLEKVEGMVARARIAGADVVSGGERAEVPDLPDGYFYRPTVIANAAPDAELAQHEVFGPVLAASPFDGEDGAIELANGTRYGLAAGVWTMNVQRAHLVARQLEAGTVFINRYRGLVPHSPFGGYKASGIGRANSVDAVDEYLQTKSVWCELGTEPDLFASG